MVYAFQPLHITLGIVTMHLFGIWVYHCYEKKMDMYEQKFERYESQIAELQQRITIMNEQQTEYKRQIAMYKKQMVINNQVNLISMFRLGSCETQAYFDHYVTKLKRYCELKDSWSFSLSSQEKDELSQLENDLDLHLIEGQLDVKSATAIVRDFSRNISKTFSSWVKVLEVALHKMDIEKMKQLQKDMNKKNVDAIFKTQMERMRKKLLNSSEELKQRGIIYRIALVFYDNFMPTITHIVVSVATNVFKNMMF